MADMEEIKRQAALERQLRRKREREAAEEANPFEELMSAGTTDHHHAPRPDAVAGRTAPRQPRTS